VITLKEQIEAVDKLVIEMRDEMGDEVTAQRLEAASGTLLEVETAARPSYENVGRMATNFDASRFP
jgi:hypothetical protein